MKFRFNSILLIFLFVFAESAQTAIVSPTPQVAEDENCGLTRPEPFMLDISVWSSKFGYLKDLSYKNFEIYLENTPHEIDSFVNKNEPASVAVLFDLSNSMKGQRSGVNEVSVAAQGFKTFLEESHPENEYTLITFGEEIKTVQESTADRETVRKTLDEIKKSNPNDKKTILYDGIQAGFDKILKGKHRRKILFLFTDGINNGSKGKFDKINKLSKKENVTVYFIKVITEDNSAGIEEFFSFRAIPVLKREFTDLNVASDSATSYYANNSNIIELNEMASDSGGRFFYPTDVKETSEIFRDIAEETKSQYLLGVYPMFPDKTDLGKIKVKLNLPKEKLNKLGKISVRTKSFYYLGKS